MQVFQCRVYGCDHQRNFTSIDAIDSHVSYKHGLDLYNFPDTYVELSSRLGPVPPLGPPAGRQPYGTGPPGPKPPPGPPPGRRPALVRVGSSPGRRPYEHSRSYGTLGRNAAPVTPRSPPPRRSRTPVREGRIGGRPQQPPGDPALVTGVANTSLQGPHWWPPTPLQGALGDPALQGFSSEQLIIELYARTFQSWNRTL